MTNTIKKLKKNIFSKTAFMLCVMLLLGSLENIQAQPPFDPDVDDETPAAPIDGFIALSIIAGAGLGIRKLKK